MAPLNLGCSSATTNADQQKKKKKKKEQELSEQYNSKSVKEPQYTKWQ